MCRIFRRFLAQKILNTFFFFEISIGTIGVINTLSSNSVWVFNIHVEHFITMQPNKVKPMNHFFQSLTYNDSKSAKYVDKGLQIWNSVLVCLGIIHGLCATLARIPIWSEILRLGHFGLRHFGLRSFGLRPFGQGHFG